MCLNEETILFQFFMIELDKSPNIPLQQNQKHITSTIRNHYIQISIKIPGDQKKPILVPEMNFYWTSTYSNSNYIDVC
jgi:hypothetical protein